MKRRVILPPRCASTPLAIFLTCIYMCIIQWLVSVMIGWNPFFCWVVGVPSGLDLVLRNDRQTPGQTDSSQSVNQSPDHLIYYL